LEKEFQEELKNETSKSLKVKLVTIKNLVVERLALEHDFKLQAAKLQSKYEDIYKPNYDNRQKVVSGDLEPTFDENTKVWETKTVTSTGTEIKGIPDFWLRCIENNTSFGKLVNDKDKKVLKHLNNITIDNQLGFNFTLTFHFSPNEFFDHPTLTRTFTFDDKKSTIEKIVSTKINWKSEDLNPGIEKKKKKIKKGKETKVITKVSEVPSFFRFFKSYDIAELEKKDNKEKEKDKDDDEEGEEDEGMEILEDELDLGNQFRDEIIPYAIEYFLNVVGGEEDMDDDYEEEEEEEEPEDKKKGKKGKK